MVVGSSPAAPAIFAQRSRGTLPPVDRIRRFIDEAWSELKKVTWPTREQTRNLTVLVLVISAAIGLYITVFDVLFTQVVQFLTT